MRDIFIPTLKGGIREGKVCMTWKSGLNFLAPINKLAGTDLRPPYPIPLEPPIPKTEEGPSNPSGSGRRGGGTEDVLGAAANEGGIEDAPVAAAAEGGSCHHVPEKSLAREPPQEDERESKATRQRKAPTRRGEKQRRLRKKAEAPVPIEGWEEGPRRMVE